MESWSTSSQHPSQHDQNGQSRTLSQYGVSGTQSLLPPTASYALQESAPTAEIAPKARLPCSPAPESAAVFNSLHNSDRCILVSSESSEANFTPHATPTTSQSPCTRKPSQCNFHRYPLSRQLVEIDAIERLQTQTSQNSGALAAHTRDIRRGAETFHQLEDLVQGQLIRQSAEVQRLEDAVARLHHEMQGMHHVMEGLSHDLHAWTIEKQASRTTIPPNQMASTQDTALELMAQQIVVISQRVLQVDALHVTMEILKNKVQRLEEERAPTSALLSTDGATVQSDSKIQTSKPSVPAPAAVPHTTLPSQSAALDSYHPISSSATPSTRGKALKSESPPIRSTGWVTVNSGAKRANADEMGTPYATDSCIYGSSKRPRFATSEPQSSFAVSQDRAINLHADSNTGITKSNFPPPMHREQSQCHSESATSSRYFHHGLLATRGSGSSDHPPLASQHTTEQGLRGRGRGGNLGGRGRRGRKRTTTYSRAGATSDWRGLVDLQLDTKEQRGHIINQPQGFALLSSGGERVCGGYAPDDRVSCQDLQSAVAGQDIYSLSDPYEHTKKTRTKPIRNADGVLIRKDGRPDMRSQSSAANLRKVHARKEGDLLGSLITSTTTRPHESVSPSTPSSGRRGSPMMDINFHKRHEIIMDKMFPAGVEESRTQHDYTRGAFNNKSYNIEQSYISMPI